LTILIRRSVMKKKMLFAIVVIGLVLIFATPAIADNTGITGKAVDGYGNGWQHGGTVYIIEDCTYIEQGGGIVITGGSLLGTTNLVTGSGTDAGDFFYDFDGASITDPVCVHIVFNDPGPEYPPPQDAQDGPFYTQLPWVSGVLSVGNISTGTGPTAVTLANAAVESPNVWLPALSAIGLVSVGGVVLLLRRRRIA
jgi:hypothetical protein